MTDEAADPQADLLISQLMVELSQCFERSVCDGGLLSLHLCRLMSVLQCDALAIYQPEHSGLAGIMVPDVNDEFARDYAKVAVTGLQFPERLSGAQLQIVSVSRTWNGRQALLLPVHSERNAGYLLLCGTSNCETIIQQLAPWRQLLNYFLSLESVTSCQVTETLLQQQATSAAEAICWQLDTKTGQLELGTDDLQWFGLKKDLDVPLTQQWLFQQMHPDDADRCRSAFERHLHGETSLYDCVGRIWHQGGYWIWVHCRGKLQCKAGQPNKMLGLFFDVSERMQTQLQLETLTACVPGVVFQYLRRVDGSRCFPYLSPQAEKLLSLPLHQLRQDATPLLQKVHPEDLPVLSQQLDQSSNSLAVLQARFRLRDSNGDYLWYLGKAQPELLPCGDVLWHGHLSDISAEIAVEEEMRIAREQAEQASRFKSSFLANMSHEIRTPMNGVLGMLDVLSAGLTEPQQRTNIRIMRDAATALLTVIDDILDFSKLDAGKLAVVPEPCEVTTLLAQIVGVLDELAFRQQVFLSYFIDPVVPSYVLADSGRVRQILLNLLSNAIKFSSGTGRQGRVHLALTVLDQDKHDVLLSFSVRDNGIGMSEVSQQRLFKPFIQADDSTSRRFGGTGLGLSISQQLVHLMGGLIEVSSQLELGSEFKVMLPLQALSIAGDTPGMRIKPVVVIISEPTSTQASDWLRYLQATGCEVQILTGPDAAILTECSVRVWLIDVSTDALSMLWLDLAGRIRKAQPEDGIVMLGRGRRRVPRLLAEKQVYLDANVLSRQVLYQAIELALGIELSPDSSVEVLPAAIPQLTQRILVLEDNSTNQIVIRQMLLQLGYQSDLAADGVQGLQSAQQQRYDLILTDLHMPLLDGYEFCRAWRDIEELQQRQPTPVLALTANVRPEEQQRCLEAGMNGCLTKPLPISALQQALQQWLPASPASASDSQPEEPVDRTSVLDFDRILLAKTVGEDAVEEVLADYASAYHQTMPAMTDAMANQQFGLVAALAHKLKSSTAFVGLHDFSDALVLLEQVARSGSDLDALNACWISCQHHALQVSNLFRRSAGAA
ncbi:ATP-binding protein [Rheinheimera tilapiae]|uniref:histidine kinase n=1 Tax=Rheinheimera tilapiae TaxID=875043 RepID=A0ABV6BE39_9GAMM